MPKLSRTIKRLFGSSAETGVELASECEVPFCSDQREDKECDNAGCNGTSQVRKEIRGVSKISNPNLSKLKCFDAASSQIMSTSEHPPASGASPNYCITTFDDQSDGNSIQEVETKSSENTSGYQLRGSENKTSSDDNNNNSDGSEALSVCASVDQSQFPTKVGLTFNGEPWPLGDIIIRRTIDANPPGAQLAMQHAVAPTDDGDSAIAPGAQPAIECSVGPINAVKPGTQLEKEHAVLPMDDSASVYAYTATLGIQLATKHAVALMDSVAVAPGAQRAVEHAVASVDDKENVGVATALEIENERKAKLERDGIQENVQNRQDVTLFYQQSFTEGKNVIPMWNVNEPSTADISPGRMELDRAFDSLKAHSIKVMSERVPTVPQESQYITKALQWGHSECPNNSATDWDYLESTLFTTTAAADDLVENINGSATACQQLKGEEQEISPTHLYTVLDHSMIAVAQEHSYALPNVVTNVTSLANTSDNMSQTMTSGVYAMGELGCTATHACMQISRDQCDQLAKKSVIACKMVSEVADAATDEANITRECLDDCGTLIQPSASQHSAIPAVPLPVVITSNSDTSHGLIPTSVDAFNTDSPKANGAIVLCSEQISYPADSFNDNSTQTIDYRDAHFPPIPTPVESAELNKIAETSKAVKRKICNRNSSKNCRDRKKIKMAALNDEDQREHERNKELKETVQKHDEERKMIRSQLPDHVLRQIYDHMLDGNDVVPDNIISLLMESRRERSSMLQRSSNEQLIPALNETSQLPTSIHNNRTQDSQRLAPISTLIPNNTTMLTFTDPTVGTGNQYLLINVTPSSGQLASAFPVSVTQNLGSQQLIVANITQGYHLIPRTDVNNMPPGTHHLAPMPTPYNMTQLTDNPTLLGLLHMQQGIQEMETKVMPPDELMSSDID